MSSVIPKGAWRKGSQWFVLIRKHAKKLSQTPWFSLFSRTIASVVAARQQLTGHRVHGWLAGCRK